MQEGGGHHPLVRRKKELCPPALDSIQILWTEFLRARQTKRHHSRALSGGGFEESWPTWHWRMIDRQSSSRVTRWDLDLSQQPWAWYPDILSSEDQGRRVQTDPGRSSVVLK